MIFSRRQVDVSLIQSYSNNVVYADLNYSKPKKKK